MNPIKDRSKEDHILFSDLTEILQSMSGEVPSVPLADHLKECQMCREMTDLVGRLAQMAADLRPAPEYSHPAREEMSEIMVKTYELTLKPKEAANFLNHLKNCPACFTLFKSELEDSLQPLPEGIAEETERYSQISLAETVLGSLPPKSSRLPQFNLDVVFEKVRALLNLERLGLWRLGMGFVILCMISLMSYFGLHQLNVVYPIKEADKLLREKYRVYLTEARLSGGYRLKGIRQLMAPEKPAPERQDYLSRALRLTEKALRHGAHSLRAELMLAQIFMMQKQYTRADSLLDRVSENFGNSAPVFNDLGVLKYQQNSWKEAVFYFESAIHADPGFGEAYYNLALTKYKLGQINECISTMKKYLAIETDEGWKNAALSFLRKLEAP